MTAPRRSRVKSSLDFVPKALARDERLLRLIEELYTYARDLNHTLVALLNTHGGFAATPEPRRIWVDLDRGAWRAVLDMVEQRPSLIRLEHDATGDPDPLRSFLESGDDLMVAPPTELHRCTHPAGSALTIGAWEKQHAAGLADIRQGLHVVKDLGTASVKDLGTASVKEVSPDAG